MDSTLFIERLLGYAAAGGIPLSPRQAGHCWQHVSLMLQWNRRVNLTRITAFEEILTKHLLDSLLPARWLPHSGPALDVGSGAGFPGVPLRICLPGLDMVLLEAVRKKASFLKVLITALELQNLRALQKRWQELVPSSAAAAQCRYSLVTMRAIRCESQHLTRLAAGVLQPGGVFAWWAGPSRAAWSMPPASVLQKSGLRFVADHHYTLPGAAAERRHILLWQKES